MSAKGEYELSLPVLPNILFPLMSLVVRRTTLEEEAPMVNTFFAMPEKLMVHTPSRSSSFIKAPLFPAANTRRCSGFCANAVGH